jgi:hypothetical protein
MAKQAQTNWINEDEALKLLGYKKPDTLRKYCKNRTIAVNMAKLSRQHFVYNKVDIDAHINSRALLPVA